MGKGSTMGNLREAFALPPTNPLPHRGGRAGVRGSNVRTDTEQSRIFTGIGTEPHCRLNKLGLVVDIGPPPPDQSGGYRAAPRERGLGSCTQTTCKGGAPITGAAPEFATSRVDPALLCSPGIDAGVGFRSQNPCPKILILTALGRSPASTADQSRRRNCLSQIRP